MIKAYKVQITGIISITDRGTHPENWGIDAIYDVLKDGAIDLQITELVEPQEDHDSANHAGFTCANCAEDQP
jgi:hypothetical protein